MFKHLLVPTDGTEFSTTTVQRAIKFPAVLIVRLSRQLANFPIKPLSNVPIKVLVI